MYIEKTRDKQTVSTLLCSPPYEGPVPTWAYVLEDSIDALFKEFKRDSSTGVGRSFFFKHRMKLNQSLCEPCENFHPTLEVLILGKFNSAFKTIFFFVWQKRKIPPKSMLKSHMQQVWDNQP